MAFLRYDIKNLNIDVLVGALEKYTPNKDIKRIVSINEDIKKQISDYFKDLFGEKTELEYKEILKNKEEKEKFQSFLKEKIHNQILLLKDEINKINSEKFKNTIQLKGGLNE